MTVNDEDRSGPDQAEVHARFADCWFLTGPTASGKSALALGLAKLHPIEIVAMDSMTLYRGLDIGTAKPSKEEQQSVPHHLIDVLDPEQPATLDWYLRQAEQICNEIRRRGRIPLFVGGTPLYLKSCLRGIFDGPAADQTLRAQLEEWAELEGNAVLQNELQRVDPEAAQRIHLSDRRRLVRAIEVFRLTGRPISTYQRQFDCPNPLGLKVACITRPREELYDRINRRVDLMMAQGWIEEVQSLLESGKSLGREASQAAGYKEILTHLAGDMSYEQMLERIKIRTRQLSKRQMTWFRHIEECTVFEFGDSTTSATALQRVAAFFAAK